MAFPAADMGLGNRPIHFLTVGGYLDASLEQCFKRPGNAPMQLKEFAGISLQHARHRTCLAQVTRPTLA
jgi:hypothetical protein